MNKKLLIAYLSFCSCLLGLFASFLLSSFLDTKTTANQKAKSKLATNLLLVDFCLSTESRHTRHFTMPETIAPFQDLPAYHDHFPSSMFLVKKQ